MTNARNALIKKQFLRLREFFNEIYGGCIFCGAVSWDFCHVRPTEILKVTRGRGRKERYYDIINNLDCYRPMCKQCHRWYDSSLTCVLEFDQYRWILDCEALENYDGVFSQEDAEIIYEYEEE